MAAVYMLILLFLRLLHLFHFRWALLHPWSRWFVILLVLMIVDFVIIVGSRRRSAGYLPAF